MKQILAWSVMGLMTILAAPGARGATVVPSEPVAWRFAHPEAQVVAGVDFRKLAQSPDGAEIRAQFAAALGASLLEQTERLLMSSVFDSGGRRSDVLILSGSFSLPQLRKLAMREGARMTPYKGLEIAAPAGATAADPHLAWITGPGGGTTVLIGTRPAIQAAAERSKAQVVSMASVNPLFERALDLWTQYPVWVTCDTVPQGLGPKSLDRYVEGNSGAEKGPVEGFDAGIRPGADGEVNFWVWAANEPAAQQVLLQLQSGAKSGEKFLLSSWLGDLKATIEGSTLAMGTVLPVGSAASRVGPLLAAFALPVELKAPAATPVPVPVPVRAKVGANLPPSSIEKIVAEAPKQMVVRIQGLDDGARSIPYPAKP
jgi:hypothetical protein